jgi:proline dehydrogenase
LAESKGVRLLFDAEQASIQKGIDSWTLEYMRKYNTRGPCVYGTYQAYLKSCPETLASHLRAARDGGFSVGVKLVRGAYLGSDPRHLIHDTKEDTDKAYNSVASAVLAQEWTDKLRGSGEFPEASLVVASHNAESVQMARGMVERGEAKSEVVIAQLMGMADEVSCTLLPGAPPTATTGVKAYKYLVWGSMGECMKYLVRRAYENQEAVGRTRDGRDAMAKELVRRTKALVGV